MLHFRLTSRVALLQASHHGLGYQTQGPPETMLERLNRSLSSSLWTPEEGDEDYEYRNVGDLKAKFNQRRGESCVDDVT